MLVYFKRLRKIMSELYDITIVGGGPVGLFAAFYAHLRQAKVKIIDSLPQLGGQPAILYPEKKILDVPGFTNLSGEELTQRLIEQLELSRLRFASMKQCWISPNLMMASPSRLLKPSIRPKPLSSPWEAVPSNQGLWS